MSNYVTIRWAKPVPWDYILDTKTHTPIEKIRFGAKRKLYYVTGENARTREKRIYIGKASDTSVYDRLKDHKNKHDMLYGCINVQVRIGTIIDSGDLGVSCQDEDLVDQVESILIHEFKNFTTDLGDMMIDNDQKVDSYTKYYDIDGIYNEGDIDDLPEELNTDGHNAL